MSDVTGIDIPAPIAGSTHDRILDAAIESVSLFGVTKMSLSDVARRAGISRPTLYKYFASKDDLVGAAVARETAGLVRRVVDAVDGVEGFDTVLELAIVAALRFAREHPLLDRIIRTEPQTLVPFLVTDRESGSSGVGGAAALSFVRAVADQLVAASDVVPDPVVARRLSDLVARLLVSFAISAPDDPPEVVARAVSQILVHGVLAASVPPVGVASHAPTMIPLTLDEEPS